MKPVDSKHSGQVIRSLDRRRRARARRRIAQNALDWMKDHPTELLLIFSLGGLLGARFFIRSKSLDASASIRV